MRNILIAILLLVAAVPANADSGCTTADLIRLGVNNYQAEALGCDALHGDVLPSTDGTYDLGSSSYEWQDLFVDGTANIDTLVADLVTPTAFSTTLKSDTDNTDDLGTSTVEWKDLYIDGTAYLDAADIGTLTYSKSITLTFSAFNSVVGATGGWTPPTGLDKALLVCPASQTNSTAVVPVSGLQVGDVITAFKITGQVESAGNTATVDADLRKLTPAAAGTADASIGAITQISKTADYEIADSKTLAAAETVASGESFYVLLTATTAASTDVEISTVEITVTRTY